jgi:hypothetical protein
MTASTSYSVDHKHYSIRPAKYASRQYVVRCAPTGTGYKGRADLPPEEAEIEFHRMDDERLLDTYNDMKANYRDAISRDGV